MKCSTLRRGMVVMAALAIFGAHDAYWTRAAEPSTQQLREWGDETLAAIRRDFWLADLRLYAETKGPRRTNRRQPAFMWSSGVQLSALAAAANVDHDKYGNALVEYADSLQTYWGEFEGKHGFDVQPSSTSTDRYYDDNAWVGLALVEAWEATQDRKYLARADETLKFVLSGEDDQLGGGIFWRENRRTSKNTCSNAPAIVAALRLYQTSNRPEHLAAATRLYRWTCKNLQDSDGLFWDSMRLDGQIDQRKYSYNSALMVRANCLFYEQTGETHYLEQAQRIGRAAEGRWIDGDSGAIRDAGKFAHLLLEAFLAINEHDHDAHWPTIVNRSLGFVHDQVRDANGRYPGRWDQPPTEPLRRYALIDQASAARAYIAAVRFSTRLASKGRASE
jgi:mannose/cellobiose epimerase-like protein (N-acyl-D-glucosamine 2-epimerase family)